jgi:hypothetical protein
MAEAKQAIELSEACYREDIVRVRFGALCRAISNQSDGFQQFILGDGLPDQAIARYNWFRLKHDYMRSFVQVAERCKATGQPSRKMNLLASGYIDENGQPQIEFDPFVKALFFDEKLKDARYIRQCGNQNCRLIFWAGREDQNGCDESCSEAYRKQRQRRRDRVLKAVKEGSWTPQAIGTVTKLLLDDVGDLLAQLEQLGKVESRLGEGERKFYAVLKTKPQRQRKLPDNTARVRTALGQGRGLTRDEISRQTGLSDNETSKAIGDLNKEYDQVKSRLGAAGERVFYLTRSAKEGR